MIVLSLLVAVLIGRGEPKCEVHWTQILSAQQVTLPSDLHTKPLNDIFGATGKMDCTHHNTEKNLTYALKALHNGAAVDVDSIGCFEDPSSIIRKRFFYIKKGESKRTLFTFPNTVDFFCAIPIDRACENPFNWQCDKSSMFHCPTFTKGSDREAAKLECADNKWRINNKNQVITEKPLCKKGAKYSGPAFYIKLPSGGEAQVDGWSTRCYKKADDTDGTEHTANNSHGTSSSRSSSNPVPIVVISIVIIGSIAICCGVCIAVCVVVKKNNKRRAQQFANMYPPYGQQAGNYPRQQYPPVQSVNESATSDPSVKEETPNCALVPVYMMVPQ